MKEYNEYQHEQKAIEEMAKDLYHTSLTATDLCREQVCEKCPKKDLQYCDEAFQSDELQKLGYEKIPKGAYIRYRWQDKRIYKRIKRLLKSRKQTQRDIFEKLFSYIGSQQQFCIVNDNYKTLIDCDKLFEFVGNLAKQYGVEVEE